MVPKSNADVRSVNSHLEGSQIGRVASNNAVLVANDVSVSYRGTRAVNKISFVVPAASVVGVVGESGSGKTSLALATTGLLPVEASEILFLGKSILGLDKEELRNIRGDVQIIFQNPHASLDPRQKVVAGFKELRKIFPERTHWITDEDLMDRVHLDRALLHSYPHQLSGGQAQRVCIARALIYRPRLLIADEPTSGLDVSVQALILELLLELREKEQLSILFISHDLSVVRRVCSYVYVMRHGELVEEGPVSDVLENPKEEYTKKLLASVPGRSRKQI
jgi:ABC-type glutathione transport system ATPase component